MSGEVGVKMTNFIKFGVHNMTKKIITIMKGININSTIAVTLIIMGTLLILVPPIVDLILNPNPNGFNLADTGMNNLQSFALWATGTLMILVAIIGTCKGKTVFEKGGGEFQNKLFHLTQNAGAISGYKSTLIF